MDYFNCVSRKLAKEILEMLNNYKIYSLENKIHGLAQISYVRKP